MAHTHTQTQQLQILREHNLQFSLAATREQHCVIHDMLQEGETAAWKQSLQHLTASALAMQPESGQKCAAKGTAAHRSKTPKRHVLSPTVLSRLR